MLTIFFFKYHYLNIHKKYFTTRQLLQETEKNILVNLLIYFVKSIRIVILIISALI